MQLMLKPVLLPALNQLYSIISVFIHIPYSETHPVLFKIIFQILYEMFIAEKTMENTVMLDHFVWEIHSLTLILALI